jgi:membrane protease YdiL (CAAX protease family)
MLLAPLIGALIMLLGAKNKELRKDFYNRIWQYRRIRINFLPIIFLLMPLVLFLATLLSLVFGYSFDQFHLSNHFEVIKGQIWSSLLILALAPLLEELGWRGYGVDSLRSRFNLFYTSLFFALLWGLFHLPLFFIKDYYHHELWEMGGIYTVNFFLSVLAGSILMNWIYYKNNRSIIAAFLFHFMINLFSVLFQTEQFTKCILTAFLLLLSAFIVVGNKEFFFSKKAWFS